MLTETMLERTGAAVSGEWCVCVCGRAHVHCTFNMRRSCLVNDSTILSVFYLLCHFNTRVDFWVTNRRGFGYDV